MNALEDMGDVAMKKKIWFIVIGIFILALDIRFPVGKAYPEMVKALNLGETLQTLVRTNFIGDRPQLDIMPDILGFLFIFIGCAMLMKKDIRFFAAMLLIPFAIVLNLYTPIMPYRQSAGDLYLGVAGYQFLTVILEILVEFFVIHGIVKITNCLQNKWHTNEMLAGWIIAMGSKGLLVGIDFFFGEKIFYTIYSVIFIGTTVFYVNRLFKLLEFAPSASTGADMEE